MENTRKTRFNNIYKTTFSSGCGSEPENITFFNHFLHNFIQEKGVKSILDLACGNFNSMNQICNNNPMLQYVGADISEIIIQHNIEHNIINNNIQFMILDVVKDNISHFTQDLTSNLQNGPPVAHSGLEADVSAPYFHHKKSKIFYDEKSGE